MDASRVETAEHRAWRSGEETAILQMWMKESDGEQKRRAPTWHHCTQRDIHRADGRRVCKGIEKK